MIFCKICGKIEDRKYTPTTMEKMEERSLCFSCNFWTDIIEEKDSEKLVSVGGHCYFIGKALPSTYPSRWKGFGGRAFFIQFNDGRYVKTTNLWDRGEIPAHFKEQLPTNAKFVDYRQKMGTYIDRYIIHAGYWEDNTRGYK